MKRIGIDLGEAKIAANAKFTGYGWNFKENQSVIGQIYKYCSNGSFYDESDLSF